MQPKEMKQRLRAALAQPGQAMHEAVELLAISRPMDPSGAALVLEREPGLGGLLARGPGAAGELAELITGLALARRCLGCGTCCLTSSPTLYAEDLDRVTSGGLDRQALYALRPGERVSSAREGETKLLDRELIKLRERQTSPDASGGHAPGRGCLFLEAGRCGIYEIRPLQCRVLECWSGRHAGELAGRPRLTRAMLFGNDGTALALMAEYDHKLPASELTQTLQAAARGDAGAKTQALAMLEMDHNLRQGVSRRYGYSAGDLDLMWGRPAVLIARAHGLEPVLNHNGQVALRKTQPNA
jgi:Fe-S-cluster containining protein